MGGPKITTLDKCEEGEYVTLWCIGTMRWDDDTVKIKENSVLVEVEYRDGSTGRFSSSTECKRAGH